MIHLPPEQVIAGTQIHPTQLTAIDCRSHKNIARIQTFGTIMVPMEFYLGGDFVFVNYFSLTFFVTMKIILLLEM